MHPAKEGPIVRTIKAKLDQAFNPRVLLVVNESHLHSVPPDSESHFKVVVASDAFSDQSLVGRHRAVHAVLAEELATAVHALSIDAMTLKEWVSRGQITTTSPPCGGGSQATATETA